MRSGAGESSKQVATDAQGHRRFHGAFEGGFSAGYFNSVGSQARLAASDSADRDLLRTAPRAAEVTWPGRRSSAPQEGWAPSSFVSSRNNRSRRPAASIADFMDDGTLLAPLGSSPNSGPCVSASLSATDCLRRRAFCSPNGRPRRQKQLRPAFSAPLSCPSTVVRLPLRRCQRARARGAHRQPLRQQLWHRRSSPHSHGVASWPWRRQILQAAPRHAPSVPRPPIECTPAYPCSSPLPALLPLSQVVLLLQPTTFSQHPVSRRRTATASASTRTLAPRTFALRRRRGLSESRVRRLAEELARETAMATRLALARWRSLRTRKSSPPRVRI